MYLSGFLLFSYYKFKKRGWFLNSQKKRERIESSSNNLMSIKENINRLDNNVLLCKKYKEETIKYVKRLKEQHNRGIFTYAEYEYMLNKC